jgi:hypothetical protein
MNEPHISFVGQLTHSPNGQETDAGSYEYGWSNPRTRSAISMQKLSSAFLKGADNICQFDLIITWLPFVASLELDTGSPS